MSLPKEYILFCDESDRKGTYYSNFYGGVLVDSNHWERVEKKLESAKLEAGIRTEVKWSKVGPIEALAYPSLLDAFFAELKAGHLSMRVMFRQNAQVPRGLSSEHRKNEYFLLYYQFLKHGFGFSHMPDHSEHGVNLRFYLDKLPNQNRESKEQFRGYLAGLSSLPAVRQKGLRLTHDNIAEVDSKSHVLLQCMDVVLGSIAFRLNDKHRIIPEGSRIRGKRTIAKEKLYKQILGMIKITTDKPNFNIGVSTSLSAYPEGRWKDRYLHWSFKSSDSELDKTRTKKGSIRPKGL